MNSEITLKYRTEKGVQFRLQVRPNQTGPGWELTKERKIGTEWHETTRTLVYDVYADTDDPVLL